MLKLGPDEAYGHDAQESDEQKRCRTGRGCFRRHVEETSESNRDCGNLGEPSNYWQLHDTRDTTADHQYQAPAQGYRRLLSNWDEGLSSFKVGEGNQAPHGERETKGNGKIRG